MILGCFLDLIRRLAREEQGSVLPVMALSIPVIFGFAALAIDASRLYMIKNELQIAADAAAIGSVREIGTGRVDEVATELARVNLHEGPDGQTVTAEDVEVGTWNKDLRTFTPGGSAPNAVRVTARRTETNFLAGVLGQPEADVVAASIAIAAGAPTCILILHQAASDALAVKGSSYIEANECVVRNNSNSVGSTRVDGDARISAAQICLAGGVVGDPRRLTPAPEYCPPLADPLAALLPPSIGCTKSSYALEGGKETISPGIYCGGITVKNKGELTLNKGEYVIKDGVLRVSEAAKLLGSGVMFYFVGSSAGIVFENAGSIDLSGPTTGPYAGMLFFGDRGVAQSYSFKNAQDCKLNGVVYLPRGNVLLENAGWAESISGRLAVIVERMRMDNRSTLKVAAGADRKAPRAELAGPPARLAF